MKKLLLGVNILFLCVTAHGQHIFRGHIEGAYDMDSIHGKPGKMGDGIGTLGQSYIQQNVCGLNYISASQLTETRSRSGGINTNGTGVPTTLNLTGLPCGGGSILKAYAYWAAEYTEASAPTASIIITNSAASTSTVVATNIGTGPFTQWSPANGTACYRADITAEISGDGAYNVNITGFANANWEVDGVTIIVIYQDLTATYSGSISLWDGCIINTATSGGGIGPLTYNGFTACAATTNDNAFVLLGDCQVGINSPAVVTNDLNGTINTFPAAFWQFNVNSSTTIVNGQTSIIDSTYTNDVNNDSYLWELSGLYMQNTTCVTCNPSVFTYTNTITPTSCGFNNGAAVVTVSGASGTYTYHWSTGSTTDSIYGMSPGTYTATITSPGGCQVDNDIITIPTSSGLTATISTSKDSVCAGTGDTLTLWGSGGTTYLWSPGGSTNSTIHINLPATTTYTLYTYGGGCIDSAKKTLKIIPITTATITAGSDTLSCPGGSTTLTAVGSGGAVTYKWSNGQTSALITVIDTGTETYTVTVYGICDSVKVIQKVTVIPPPNLSFHGNPSPCAGSKDTITVSSSTNPTTYLWSNGTTSTSYYTGAIDGDSAISVTAENSLGCPSKAIYPITEKFYPTDTATYLPACINSPATIIANPHGTGPFSYKWSTGGTNDTIIVPNNDTMTYAVTISNGCPITQTITVTPDNPTIQACCSATIFLGGDTTIVAFGTGIITYQWTPLNSGLNCYTCPNVIASPTTTTTYTVIGTDSVGCPIEKEVTITVEIPCYNPTIPNVFTPTNAGILGMDNLFYISTTNDDLSSWSLLIFDRWGKEVYNSTNPKQYWNGNTEGGSAAPAGVYYYVISATCQSNTYKKDGFVQLIR
jgi:gliding motility-associated-like protein